MIITKYYNYRPDTCDCVICEKHEINDALADDDPAKHTFSFVESYTINNASSPNNGRTYTTSRCSVHQAITDIADLHGVVYANVHSEQKRKNHLERILLGLDTINGLNLDETVTDDDGISHRRFRNGVIYDWSFSGTGADRVLVVTVRGGNLTVIQKNAIRALAIARWGSGKLDLR